MSSPSAVKYAQILGYSQEQFIRLSLQDLVDRDGLHVEIEISPKPDADIMAIQGLPHRI